MAAAILLPATLVRLGAEWLFLAHRHGLNAIPGDSGLNQRILHRVSATGAERKVIFGRPAFVAVSFNRDVDVRMLLQESGISPQRALIGRAHIVLVIIEEDVLHIL